MVKITKSYGGRSYEYVEGDYVLAPGWVIMDEDGRMFGTNEEYRKHLAEEAEEAEMVFEPKVSKTKRRSKAKG